MQFKAGRAESPEKAEQINNKNIWTRNKRQQTEEQHHDRSICFSKQQKYGEQERQGKNEKVKQAEKTNIK